MNGKDQKTILTIDGLGGITPKDEEKLFAEIKNSKTKNIDGNGSNGKNKIVKNAELPNLSEIKEVKKTGKTKKTYEERKKWAEEAGKRLWSIERRMEEIKEDPELEFNLDLRKEFKKLEQEKKKIIGGIDKALLGHAHFSALFERIKEAARIPKGGEEIDEIIKELLRDERIGKISKWGEHCFYWKDQTYQGLPDPITGKVSNGTKALISEIKKAIGAEKRRYEKEVKEKIQEMKKNPLVDEIQAGNSGIYFGYFEPENKNPKYKNRFYFIVEKDGDIIRPVEGTGVLKPLFLRLKSEGAFLTIGSLNEDRLIVKKQLSYFNDLVRFYWTIKNIIISSPK